MAVSNPDESPAAGARAVPDARSAPDAGAGPADSPARGGERAATPSVTAVVVAHDPGEWFDETLSSFAAQDYPRLDLLVIDASGAASLADRVRLLAPTALIVDASDAEGFAAAANAVLETEVSSALLLICHDDVAPEPDAVSRLVTESLRSNAGITGPKLVDWDRPERLQHVGLLVDRFADCIDVVDPSEIDQEQYDNVADVFAVPSACMLIRRSLLEALGGFDPKLMHQGENVDLCWRAQLAGARVIVAPDAVVRHRGRLAERSAAGLRVRRVRSQLRTVLVNSSLPMLAVNLAAMAVLSLGEALIALLTLRFGHVRNLVDGWTWNLGSLGEIRRRRKLAKPVIEVPHRDVRALQVLGSVRLNAVVRAQIERGSKRLGSEFASAIRTGTTRFVLLTWAVAILFVLFGSRALIAYGPAAVGDFAALGPARDLLADWWGSWHERDLGSPGALGAGMAVTGVVAGVAGSGVARTLMVLGPVLAGLAGIWRMLADTGSRRAQMAALLGYLIVPLGWASIAAASYPGLVGYAVAPFVIRALLRAEAAAPCPLAWRSPARWLRAVLGVAAAAALGVVFTPAAVPLLPVTAAGLLVGSILAARPGGLHRIAAAAALGAAAAMLLALPQALDIARALGGGISPAEVWAAVSGSQTAATPAPALADILRFDVGAGSASRLLWLLAPATALAVLVGRSWRFELAVRFWTLALVSWALVLADGHGWLPFGLGDPWLLLAPAAAAVAGLCGLGVAAVEHDLSRVRLGLPQLAAAIALAGAVAAAAPVLALTETGRWELPREGFDDVVPFEDPAVSGSYRVLWIGHRDVLPADGRRLGYGLAYAATPDRLPLIADRDVAVDPGSSALLADVLRDVIAGETQRAGRMLGGLGVRYVVVLDRVAPAPFSAAELAHRVPPGVSASLGRQLDLRHLPGINSAMQVYENTEWTSVRAAAAPGFDHEAGSLRDLAASPISGTVGVLFGRGDLVTGSLPAGTEVFVAQTPDDAWSLEVDGERLASRPAAGWATAYASAPGGEAELRHATGLSHRLATILQLVAWIALAGLSLRRSLGAGAAP